MIVIQIISGSNENPMRRDFVTTVLESIENLMFYLNIQEIRKMCNNTFQVLIEETIENQAFK